MEFYKVFRPFFKRFHHNGMVGVRDNFGDYIPRFIPTVIIFVDHNAHQFGYAQSGVSVVDMDSHSVGEIVEVGIEFQVIFDY